MFKEISEEEYYSQIAEEIQSEDQTINIKNSIQKKAGQIITNAEVIRRDSDNLSSNDISVISINQNLWKIKESISDIETYLKNFSLTPVGKLLPKSEVENDIIFEQKGEYLRIIFPSLLPRRINPNKQNRDTISISSIFNHYYTAFFNYFSKGKHKIYDKAIIIYTHYYENENQLIDHDNFETKKITDIVTSWILPDDNPKYCTQIFRYKIGEKSHTEIEVIPQKLLNQYIL